MDHLQYLVYTNINENRDMGFYCLLGEKLREREKTLLYVHITLECKNERLPLSVLVKDYFRFWNIVFGSQAKTQEEPTFFY